MTAGLPEQIRAQFLSLDRVCGNYPKRPITVGNEVNILRLLGQSISFCNLLAVSLH
jgi:hypothetical protein